MNPGFVCGINGRIRVCRRNGERHLKPCMSNQQRRIRAAVLWYVQVSVAMAELPLSSCMVTTGRRYINEILRPHVLPYLRQMGQNAIFHDDNARPYRARIKDDFLRQNGVERLEWPPTSPDLSCIEHVGYSWPGRKQVH